MGNCSCQPVPRSSFDLVPATHADLPLTADRAYARLLRVRDVSPKPDPVGRRRVARVAVWPRRRRVHARPAVAGRSCELTLTPFSRILAVARVVKDGPGRRNSRNGSRSETLRSRAQCSLANRQCCESGHSAYRVNEQQSVLVEYCRWSVCCFAVRAERERRRGFVCW
jgi:hypothetical protein